MATDSSLKPHLAAARSYRDGIARRQAAQQLIVLRSIEQPGRVGSTEEPRQTHRAPL
jgi:hypothetical protein